MKNKILSIFVVMTLAISMVFATSTDKTVNKANLIVNSTNESIENSFREELSNEIQKNIASNALGYQELRVDETFDINKVYFDNMHTVYRSIDNLENDFIFENRYVTAAMYNKIEMADIYYTIKNNKVQNIKVVLDKSGEDRDVLINEAIKEMPAIENKEEISFYIPNDKTVVAFTENTYKMFVLKDELDRYENYVVNEADGSKTIDREDFFKLHKLNKIKNNNEFVKNTLILEIILILLLAILAILAFLSYVVLNMDKINKKESNKKTTKKAPVKKGETAKKTVKKTTTKKTK